MNWSFDITQDVATHGLLGMATEYLVGEGMAWTIWIALTLLIALHIYRQIQKHKAQ